MPVHKENSQRSLRVAYKIADDCVSCGACEDEGMNEAIAEGEEFYAIDPDRCTECFGNFESPRCAEVCPADAGVPGPEHEESQGRLLEKRRGLHPGISPAYEP